MKKLDDLHKEREQRGGGVVKRDKASRWRWRIDGWIIIGAEYMFHFFCFIILTPACDKIFINNVLGYTMILYF